MDQGQTTPADQPATATPPPSGVATTPTAATWRLRLPSARLVGTILSWGILIYMASTLARINSELKPGPRPSPTSADFKKLGRAFAPDVLSAEAKALHAGADTLRSGGSIADSTKAKHETFTAERIRLFNLRVTPALSAIAPESDSLADAAKRQALAQALDELAEGVSPAKPSPSPGPQPTPPGPTPPKDDAAGFGWVDHPSRHILSRMLPHGRTLSEANPKLVSKYRDDTAPIYLYRAWKDYLGNYPSYPAQQIGDCTSFGSGHCVDLLQCITLATAKAAPGQWKETSTEAIYGMGREIAGMLGGGDGCTGTAVSSALVREGAVTREEVGPYSGSRAQSWGRSGVPANIKSDAAKHKLGSATLVTTTDEAKAALKSGHPFIICSNQGFAMTRDATGLCEASGSWSHCMFVSGYRNQGGEDQFLICQSWGPNAPKGPTVDDQPDFSFWARGGVVGRMLAGQDSLAFSDFPGFVDKPLPAHWSYDGFAAKPESKPAPAENYVLKIEPGKTPRYVRSK